MLRYRPGSHPTLDTDDVLWHDKELMRQALAQWAAVGLLMTRVGTSLSAAVIWYQRTLPDKYHLEYFM